MLARLPEPLLARMQVMSPSHHLADDGFEVFEAGALDAATLLAASLGVVLDISDVRIRQDARTYLSAPEGIPPHTDHPAVKLIAWYCHAQHCGPGGENCLIDSYPALSRLTGDTLQTLARIELRCPMIQQLEGTGSWPMYRPAERALYYAPWHVKEESCAALLAFAQEIGQASHRRLVRLNPGQVLLINNQRMLHYREALPHQSNRWLTRFWIG